MPIVLCWWDGRNYDDDRHFREGELLRWRSGVDSKTRFKGDSLSRSRNTLVTSSTLATVVLARNTTAIVTTPVYHRMRPERGRLWIANTLFFKV